MGILVVKSSWGYFLEAAKNGLKSMIRHHATNQETDSLRRLAKYEAVWLAMWDYFTPGV